MRNLTLFRCYRKVFSQLCPILVILLLISSIVPVSGLVSVLDYDANGNLVSDGRYAYTYDGFNQLIRINEGSLTGPTVAEYTYGPDKERIKKVEYNNGTATTSYYPSKDVIYTENSTGISATIYYYDDYVLVARKDPNGKNYFYHPNHLGSTDIVTNETGAVVEDIDYLPFGETQDDDRFLFTGKEKDSESGLMYYGARYYNPSTMRFTQPDTMLPDIYDPQQLNRYAYARNNPQTYVDPSGHFIDTLFDIGFIGWDIWNIIKSPRSRDNWVSLGLDTVGAFVPFATGLGAGYRVAKYGGKAAKLFERGKGASGVGKRIFESAKAVKSAKAAKDIKQIPISKLYGHATNDAKKLFREGATTHQTNPIEVIGIGKNYMINDGVGRSMRGLKNGEKYVNARIIRSYESETELNLMAQFDDMAKTDKAWWNKKVTKMTDTERWKKLGL